MMHGFWMTEVEKAAIRVSFGEEEPGDVWLLAVYVAVRIAVVLACLAAAAAVVGLVIKAVI